MSGPLGPRIATVYELQSAWLEPRLKAMGVRWTTFQLLVTILACGERATQVEVAARLGVAPATLCESVQAHVAAGIVTQRAASDKRVKLLGLTPSGKTLTKKIGALVAEVEALAASGLSERDAAACASTLDRMISSLEKVLENAPKKYEGPSGKKV